jgi:thioredoxin-like negative regulator of GroEL
MFYAPWNDVSKRLEPEFEQAAINLYKQEPDIRLIKIDVGENVEAAEYFEIAAFPTILFLNADKRHDLT